MKKIWNSSTTRERIVLCLVLLMGISGVMSIALMAFPSLAVLGFVTVCTFCFSGIIAMGVAFA